MQFSKKHLDHFGALTGAGSIVTKTEFDDPQITIDRFERKIINSVIDSAKIFRGSRREGGDKVLHPFIKHSTGEELQIPLNYPKGKENNELRLYIPKQSDFRPPPGHFWFVFVKDGRLHVGDMTEKEWREIEDGGASHADDDDSRFQQALLSNAGGVLESKTLSGKKYSRNLTLARQAKERAGFRCGYKPDTPSFLTKANNAFYVETHHFVPFHELDKLGGVDLDRLDNMIALSPYWHRVLHHGLDEEVEPIIRELAKDRKPLLRRVGLNIDDLLYCYRRFGNPSR
jgi:hypothetical protein